MVKSYPNPSQRYGESICVAGVTRDLQWIRLYPVDFRHLAPAERFAKWQWIRSQRQAIVSQLLVPSVEYLEMADASLGAVRPVSVDDFEWETAKEVAWSTRQVRALRSANESLFHHPRTVPLLEKVPYTFYYRFSCDGQCRHRMSIVDWEVLQSYRGWRHRRRRVLEEAMRSKYVHDLARKRNLHFFLGTPLRQDKYRRFLIVGLFYPPKSGQLALSFPVGWQYGR